MYCGVLVDRLGQLVGTGGSSHAADIASEDIRYLSGIFTLHKLAYSLEIAVASTDVDKVSDLAIFDIKVNLL